MATDLSDNAAGAVLGKVLHDGDVAAWLLAAVAVGLSTDEARGQAAVSVLAAAGIDPGAFDGPARSQRGAQAAASLLQAGAVARGESAWVAMSDEALLAQGRASAAGGAAFARMVDSIPGMSELLARPGAAILDVGTGVGALAVAYAEALPGVRVVGIDVMARAITLATRTVAQSSVADRVEVRLEDVQNLADVDRFAMAWVPAPFIPETALRAGLHRVTAALVPGGRLALGHGRLTGSPLEQAVTRFKTIAYGGTALSLDEAADLLVEAGLEHVSTVPTPPDGPVVTVGRRPT